MDNLYTKLNNLSLKNEKNIPQWIKNMSIISLEYEIKFIQKSNYNHLLNKNNIPDICDENSRNIYELELLNFIEKLQ